MQTRHIAASLVLAFSTLLACAHAQTNVIRPGEVWLDDRGKPIQAHGGSFLHLGDTFYWFGEDRSPENDRARRYVACYSSTDLVHWSFRRQVLALADPEHLGPHFVVERPKVFYNAKTKRFVMYLHLDAPGGEGGHYNYARVAVVTSDAVDGEYSYVRSFRPLGKESRDIGQFVDNDGTAYLIFESRPTGGFYIAKLSDDYLNVEREVAFIPTPLEAGSIVRHDGLYYFVGSHLSDWSPNPNVYATASSLAGPWSSFQNIAPPETNTYGSQSAGLITVGTGKSETIVYAGDRWNEKDLPDSRYLWMPLQLRDGKMKLPAPQPWSIDTRTGAATIAPTSTSIFHDGPR
ncbi:family 43 glycosylhydrolase [Granulicella cerasi]|uniref:Family 43 glycosylhydrolase n=1 Tax=Granulicella cerasi TaxID=741063 RepID=A0ABW1ZAR9_9BACT|nr:family 43 glycosylhydrolase [Granulicella cerasi]